MKIIIIFSLILSTMLYAEIDNEVIAIVNNKPITKMKMLDTLDKMGWNEVPEKDLKVRILRQLIADLIKEQLLKEEAVELQIEIPDNAVEENFKEELNQVLEKVGGKNNLIEELKKEGLTYEMYETNMKSSIKDFMLKQQIFNIKITGKIVVTDREALMKYDVSMILVKDYDIAKNIIEEIKIKGALFDNLAETYSTGPKAKEGGNLGIIKLGDLQPEIEKDIINLDEFGISPIIATKFGFVIIKLNKKIRIKENEISKNELNELKERLFQIKAMSAEQKLYSDLWDKYSVKINYSLLDSI